MVRISGAGDDRQGGMFLPEALGETGGQYRIIHGEDNRLSLIEAQSLDEFFS